MTLDGKIAAFQVLGDLYADLDRKVARTTMLYVHANPESKKIASEKQEMVAAVSLEEQANYLDLRSTRIKVKMGEIIINACHTAISAIQSMMKMFGNIQYGGQK
jgi:SUMO ligase MMS21 Smc5/6 complex component